LLVTLENAATQMLEWLEEPDEADLA